MSTELTKETKAVKEVKEPKGVVSVMPTGTGATIPGQQFRWIQREMKVAKTKWNKFSSFFYRSVEDIYDAWKALDVPLILHITDDVIEKGGRVFIQATASIKDLNFNIIETSKAQAELSAAGRAGMSSEQATGSASSYARKYALNGLFLLDDAKDPDEPTGGSGTKKVLPADEAAKTKAKVTELQAIIKGDKAKTAKAVELLAGRSIIKMSVKEIDEIIAKVK